MVYYLLIITNKSILIWVEAKRMKKHNITHKRGAISVSIQKVINYPFHWEKGIEIILVLEGSIYLESHKDPDVLNVYEIVQNGIHVVGDSEIHRIYSQDENNVVLLMQIDREFISEHFAYADTLEFDYLFYTYSSIEHELIERLKNQIIFLSSLVCGTKLNNNDEIVEVANRLLYTLIDNFEIINRKLHREGHSRKQYERLMQITDYLQNNVTKKDLLMEISHNEYLNPDYISHLLKKYLDFNFQQLVNFYKVEKAIRLLLETNLNISEISYECGFSAPRYLYKHFQNYHPKGPLEFRKTYQRSFNNIDFTNAYKEIEEFDSYFANSHLYETISDTVLWVSVDVSKHNLSQRINSRKSICIENFIELSDAELQMKLIQIQNEIGFHNIRISNLLCFASATNNNFSMNSSNNLPSKICQLLRFLLQIKLKPHFVLSDFQSESEMHFNFIKDFMFCCKKEFGIAEIQNWGFELSNNSNTKSLQDFLASYIQNVIISDYVADENAENSLFDTQYMASSLCNKYIRTGSIENIKPIDSFTLERFNRPFSGQNGLIASNGLLKPTYHACSLLSILGDEILQQGNEYIITSKNNSIQILLFNHIDIEFNTTDSYDNYYHAVYNEELIKKVNITIDNMKNNCKITRYDLNSNNSIYNLWMDITEPSLVNESDVAILNKISAPRITFETTDSSFKNYNITLSPYSLVLFNLEFIEVLQ